MAHDRQTVAGGDFTCPKCSALYEMTIWPRSKEAIGLCEMPKMRLGNVGMDGYGRQILQA
jgi:hypothetical protein